MDKNNKINVKENLKAKERRPYLLTMCFSLLFLLFYLLPFFTTTYLGETSYLSGYTSFTFLSDQEDSIYYAMVMIIFSLILSIGMFIVASVSYLFLPKDHLKNANRGVIAFFLLKLAFDIAFIPLALQTKTNLTMTISGYLQAVLTFLVFLGYLLMTYQEKLFKRTH